MYLNLSKMIQILILTQKNSLEHAQREIFDKFMVNMILKTSLIHLIWKQYRVWNFLVHPFSE